MKTYVDELFKHGAGPIYKKIHFEQQFVNNLDDVAANIRRLNYLLEQSQVTMPVDDDYVLEFVTGNMANFSLPLFQFEKTLDDFKERCSIEVDAPDELSLEHFIEHEIEQSLIAQSEAISQENLKTFKSYLLGSAVHDIKNNPFVMIKESELRLSSISPSNAFDLLTTQHDPIQAENPLIHDALLSSMPEAEERTLTDDFHDVAVKSFMHRYERSTGNSLCILRDATDSVQHRGISGHVGTVFEDTAASKRFLVSVQMPQNMSNDSTKGAKGVLNQAEAAHEMSWQYDALKSMSPDIEIDDVFVYQFGMAGINDYAQYFANPSAESMQFVEYFNMRHKACLNEQSSVVRDTLYKIAPDEEKVASMEQVSKSVVQRIQTGHVPEPTSVMSEEQEKALIAEAEGLMKQYAVNRKIIEQCAASNKLLSDSLDKHNDTDAEFKSHYSRMGSRKSFKRPEEIASVFAGHDPNIIPEHLAKIITKTIVKKTLVLDEKKIKQHLIDRGVDPKQFNNVIEKLMIARTNDFKQSVGPIIIDAAKNFVGQIQNTNELLLESQAHNAHQKTNQTSSISISP